MKKPMFALLAALLLAVPLAGQQIQGSPSVNPITTVAGLSAYQNVGQLATVTDGTGATDCLTGGGSTVVLCQYNGKAWGSANSAGTVAPVYKVTTPATVTNTASATSIVGTGVGTQTFNANQLVAGNTIRVAVAGNLTTDAYPQGFRVQVTLGGVAILDTYVQNLEANLTNTVFQIDGLITVQTVGATGTVIGQGRLRHNYVAGADTSWAMVNTGTTVVNTTGTLKLDVVVTWSNTDSVDSITGTNVTMEVL